MKETQPLPRRPCHDDGHEAGKEGHQPIVTASPSGKVIQAHRSRNNDGKLQPPDESNQPLTKRPRHDNDNYLTNHNDANVVVKAGQNDEEDVELLRETAALEQLVDDDGFVLAEELEAEAARQSRRQRQQRMKRLELEALTQKDLLEQRVLPGARAVAEQHIDHKMPSIDYEQIKSTIAVGEGHATAAAAPKREQNDIFDMFSSSVSPVAAQAAATSRGQEQQDWDDTEGYYKAVIGEVIPLNNYYELRVSGVIGKGVFSTVLKCTTASRTSAEASAGVPSSDSNQNPDAETPVVLPPMVAIKCIRHNETMAKSALQEIRLLLKLQDEAATGIVPLLLPKQFTTPLEYRGHTLLVFPFLPYNLRDVLQKFGKGVGLSLQSVQAYFGQLLSALYHLQKRNLLHADIKPDNILVSDNYSTVMLCDFGSAVELNSTDHLPTPYLVSRFYRAPEVILGLLPSTAMDLWSVAVSMAELFLGQVLLPGSTNNDMLFLMMQQLGTPFSHRLVRQHLMACQRLGLTASAVHFTAADGRSNAYHFLQQTFDSVTGQPVVRHVPLQEAGNPKNSSNSVAHQFSSSQRTLLLARLLKAKSAKDSRTKVLQFAELLQKCLTLDPTRRISVKEALHHGFSTTAGETK